MFSKIIGSVLVVILTIIITQKMADKAELKYNISQPIPTSANEASNKEYIQELIIKNVGKDEAKKINIKIDGYKINYDIKKHLNSDSYQEVVKSDKMVELLYDNLLPSGQITIILKCQTSLNDNSIEINHSKGKAVEAFRGNSIWSIIFSFMPVIYTILFLGYITYEIYNSANDTDASYKSESYLSRKKPILLRESKWIEFRSKAKKELIEGGWINNDNKDIKASFHYRFLDNKSNVILMDHEKDDFRNKCEKKLGDKMLYAIDHSFSMKDADKVLTLDKPDTINEDSWTSIKKHIFERYISVFVSKLYSNKSISIINNKPDYISDKDWNSLTDILDMMRFVETIKKYSQYNNFTYDDYSKTDQSYFTNEEKTAFHKLFYSNNMIKLLHEIMHGNRSDVLNNIECLYSWLNVSDKKLIVSVCNILINLEEKESALLKKIKEIEQVAAENNELKIKLTSQLNIIDKIINSDPEILDKIEYDMPFNPGNINNLKKLAAGIAKA